MWVYDALNDKSLNAGPGGESGNDGNSPDSNEGLSHGSDSPSRRRAEKQVPKFLDESFEAIALGTSSGSGEGGESESERQPEKQLYQPEQRTG